VLANTWPSAHTAFFLVTDLYQTIVRISHLLRQAQTPAEMGGIFLEPV
jgi:hypothetical protein